MLAHLFDRFYVVTKFILPSINDLNFLPIDFNSECSYLNADPSGHQNSAQCISNLQIYFRKIIPFIYFYKKIKLLVIIAQHMKY